MNPKQPIPRPTTKSIASYVKKGAPEVRKAQRHHHEASETVREADYKGHHIVVRTIYHIEVDGVPVTGHVGVTHDGLVHYHPVPNAAFSSAIDLVKQLIDVFPDDFPERGNASDPHGSHMHMAKPLPKSASQAHRPKRTRSSRT